MTIAILQIAASILGLIATWYVGKKALQWLQRYYDQQNAKNVNETKLESEKLAAKLQKESDDLRKKEEEFLRNTGQK